MFVVTEFLDNNEGGSEKGEIWLFKDLEKAKEFCKVFNTNTTYGAGYPSTFEWVGAKNLEYVQVIQYPNSVGRWTLATIAPIVFQD